MNEQAGKTRLGVIKPTTTSNSLADLQGLLPDDIEMIPEYMGFAYKSLDEFRASMPIYGDNVATLAAKGVSKCSETAALRVAKPQSAATELGFEDAILGGEVFIAEQELLIDRSGDVG